MDGGVLTLVGSLILVLALLGVGLYFVGDILGIGSQVEGLSSCESPAGTQPGMCVHQDTICAGILGYASGKALSGCPSDRIERLVEGKVDDPSLFNTCCVAATCEQVFDTLNGNRVARKSACFGDECTGNLRTTEAQCAGFSGECTAEEGCCCILGQ